MDELSTEAITYWWKESARLRDENKKLKNAIMKLDNELKQLSFVYENSKNLCILLQEESESRIDKLLLAENALRWYADVDNVWEDGDYEGGVWFSVAERDKGKKARETLKKIDV